MPHRRVRQTAAMALALGVVVAQAIHPAGAQDASPELLDRIRAERPMNAAFPYREPTCHRFQPAQPVATAKGGPKVAALELQRGKTEIEFEQQHTLDDVPYDTALTLTATFAGGGAKTGRTFMRCSTDMTTGFLCVARSCFRGHVTVAEAGPDAVTVTIGGRIAGKTYPDFVDLTQDCKGQGAPVAIESGAEPLVFRLEKRPVKECRP